MSNLFLRSLLVSPAVLGVALANTASAQDSTLAQINEYANEGAGLSQVRSVNQLSDVRPTDWAYQALRSLVERYGCIAGYPDGTFRGNRAMTRYEFAAGLNACLDTVNELIASATADLATQEDLLVLQRLQEEFQAELATLRGRVDALEARTAELEANQFSTTTKLSGQVVFALQDVFGDSATTTESGVTSDFNTAFGGRVRLNLTSSFTGSDQLVMRLESENVANTSTLTAVRPEWGGTGLDFNLDDLHYAFKPTAKSYVVVGPIGTGAGNFIPTDAWHGGSFFTDYNDGTPIQELDADEVGIGGNYQFNDTFNLALGFASDSGTEAILDDGSSPAEGVFIDNIAGYTQLTATTGKFEGLVAYSYQYAEDGGFTTLFDGVGVAPNQTTAANAGVVAGPTGVHTVGLAAKYNVNSRLILQAYGAYATAFDATPATGYVNAVSGAVAAIFPDLFREGNEGGIAVGIPPFIFQNNSGTGAAAEVPIAIDLYYDFKVSDNITITPQGVVLFNGTAGIGGAAAPDTTFAGAVKTTFRF